MAKRVTMDDVAKKTGFSKYAVSRALAGKSGVSEATRQKIVEESRKLGYVMRHSSVRTEQQILVFAPRRELQGEMFWLRALQGFETCAAERGYLVSLRTLEETENLEAVQLQALQAAGAVFAGHKSAELMRSLLGKVPSLLMSYPLEPLLAADCLIVSDEESIEYLLRQMLQKGHRRIAYFGPTAHRHGQALVRGLERAIGAKKNISLELWEGEGAPEVLERTESMLAKRAKEKDFPTLIMCTDDRDAQMVIYVLSKLGMKVPADVSVTTMNTDIDGDTPLHLSGMGFDRYALGKEAFYMLYHRMHHPEIPYRRVRLLQSYIEGKTAADVST